MSAMSGEHLAPSTSYFFGVVTFNMSKGICNDKDFIYFYFTI